MNRLTNFLSLIDFLLFPLFEIPRMREMKNSLERTLGYTDIN